MSAEEKPKPKRNRSKELAKRKAKRDAAAAGKSIEEAVVDAQESIRLQLALLKRRTQDRPTDADGDIDFAYRNMALPNVEPLTAPSTSAWEWYLFARNDRDEFLKICAKREDAKAKLAGTITNQRMEDDKRKQFAILDRIQKQLTLDVKEVVRDLMSKFPEDVLLECRRNKPAWDAFFAKYPFHGPDKR